MITFPVFPKRFFSFSLLNMESSECVAYVGADVKTFEIGQRRIIGFVVVVVFAVMVSVGVNALLPVLVEVPL